MVDPQADDAAPTTWKCRAIGHRLKFRAERRTMIWECERGCGVVGSKRYPTVEEARRFAAVFDRRDSQDLGRNAPLIGL